MRISLVFPLVLLFVIRLRGLAVAACFLFSLACNWCVLRLTGKVTNGVFAATVIQSLLASGYYLVFFAVGALLAIERHRVIAKVASLGHAQKVMLLLFCLYCFLKTDLSSREITGALVDYLRGLGAVILIALVLGSQAAGRALGGGALLWLGRISYSLYLVHFVILFAVHALNEALGEPVPVFSANVLAAALSLMVADSISRSVEQPFMALGSKLSRRAQPATLHPYPMGSTTS